MKTLFRTCIVLFLNSGVPPLRVTLHQLKAHSTRKDPEGPRTRKLVAKFLEVIDCNMPEGTVQDLCALVP